MIVKISYYDLFGNSKKKKLMKRGKKRLNATLECYVAGSYELFYIYIYIYWWFEFEWINPIPESFIF